jgi:hypothetical protein
MNTHDAAPAAHDEARPDARELMARRCEVLAAALVLVPGVILLLSVCGFAAGLAMQAWYAPAALLAGVFFVGSSSRAARERVLRAVLFLGVLGASLWLAVRLGDTSFDSLNYHQSAVAELHHGWNPWQGPSTGRFASERTWVDNYPQASWINAASAVLVTGRIDSGKWINFAFAAAAGFAVFALLLRATGASVRAALALAVVAAANPVTLCQMNTFYVDGTLGASILVLTAGLWLAAGLGRSFGWWLVAPSLLLLINFKHTGVAYGVFLCAGAVALRVWCTDWRKGLSTGLALLALGVAGLGFLGYAPYGKNVRQGLHVFHPVLGANRIMDFMGERKTPNISDNRVLAFASSMFARSDYPDHVARPATWKFPLMVYPSELSTWYSPDVKSGGYGPWYGALLLASTGGFAALIISRRRVRALAVLGIGTAVGAGVFCHEYAWWARYAPQGWLFASIVPAIILDLPGKAWAWFRTCVLGLGVANCAIILVVAFMKQGDFSEELDRRLDAAAQSAPVALHLDRFPVMAERFRERGIPFVVIEGDAPPGAVREPLMGGNPAVYWVRQP